MGHTVKPYRQGNSLVMSIPTDVRRELDVDEDTRLWIETEDGVMTVSKAKFGPE